MKKTKILHIYLFRHGQTFFNRGHIFTGWKNSNLTKLGHQQSRIIAKKLKNKNFHIAFCSDQARSMDTLKEVLKYHRNVKVIKDRRLRERSYGMLEGKHHSQFDKAKLRIIRRSYSHIPPKGESIKMVKRRVLAFIKDLRKLMKKEKTNIAISAHGNSMRPFRRRFENLSIGEMMRLENPYDDYFDYKIKA